MASEVGIGGGTAGMTQRAGEKAGTSADIGTAEILDRNSGCQLPKLDVAGSSPVSRSMFSMSYSCAVLVNTI